MKYLRWYLLEQFAKMSCHVLSFTSVNVVEFWEAGSTELDLTVNIFLHNTLQVFGFILICPIYIRWHLFNWCFSSKRLSIALFSHVVHHLYQKCWTDSGLTYFFFCSCKPLRSGPSLDSNVDGLTWVWIFFLVLQSWLYFYQDLLPEQQVLKPKPAKGPGLLADYCEPCTWAHFYIQLSCIGCCKLPMICT